MAKLDKEDALLKALQHPLRRSLLRRYVESDSVDGLGPKELAKALKAPLSNVSYHIRVLARLGAVQIVSTAPAGGSIAHFYEATSLVRPTRPRRRRELPRPARALAPPAGAETRRDYPGSRGAARARRPPDDRDGRGFRLGARTDRAGCRWRAAAQLTHYSLE